jgi:hypothetical protein
VLRGCQSTQNVRTRGHARRSCVEQTAGYTRASRRVVYSYTRTCTCRLKTTLTSRSCGPHSPVLCTDVDTLSTSIWRVFSRKPACMTAESYLFASALPCVLHLNPIQDVRLSSGSDGLVAQAEQSQTSDADGVPRLPKGGGSAGSMAGSRAWGSCWKAAVQRIDARARLGARRAIFDSSTYDDQRRCREGTVRVPVAVHAGTHSAVSASCSRQSFY